MLIINTWNCIYLNPEPGTLKPKIQPFFLSTRIKSSPAGGPPAVAPPPAKKIHALLLTSGLTRGFRLIDTSPGTSRKRDQPSPHSIREVSASSTFLRALAGNKTSLGRTVSVHFTRSLFLRLFASSSSSHPSQRMVSISPLKSRSTPFANSLLPPSSLRIAPRLPCALPRISMKLRCEFELKGNGALSGDSDPRALDRVNTQLLFKYSINVFP